MSLLKIILITAGVFIVVFILMLIYVFIPTIRNVSEEPVLKSLINKKLTLKKTGYLYGFEDRNEIYQLTEREDYREEGPVLELPAGTVIVLSKFKTYTNNAGSGFTHLYAYGKATIDNKVINFMYDMGSVAKKFYEDEPYSLPLTIWQEKDTEKIVIKRLSGE